MIYIEFLIVTITLLFYLSFILKRKDSFIVLFFLFIFEYVWILYSLIYIENGCYISEQFRYSFYSGSTIRYLILTLPVMLGCPIIYNYFVNVLKNDQNFKVRIQLKYIKSNRKIVSYFILFLGIMITLYIMVDYFVSGIPIINKNILLPKYYEISKLPYAYKLHHGDIYKFIVFLLGVIYTKKESKILKWMSLIAFSLCLMMSIIGGAKFQGLINYIYLFLLYPFFNLIKKYNINKLSRFFNKKTIIIFSTILLLVFSLTIKNYSHNSSSGVSNMFNRIFALQGHTFWGVDTEKYNTGSLGMDKSQLKNEWQALISGDDGFNNNVGIVKVMYSVAPKEKIALYLATGYRYYGSWVTVALLSLGYLGTFIYGFFVAFILAWILAHLSMAIESDRFIMIYLSLRLFLQFYEYFRIGNFSYYFRPSFLLVFILILIRDILINIMNRKNRLRTKNLITN